MLFRVSIRCQKALCQYVNVSVCQYVCMSICQYVRMQLFSLGIKMKVVPNVIRRKLWKSLSVRESERKSERERGGGGGIMIRTLQRLQSHSKHPRQTWQVSPSQRSLDEHHRHQSQVSGHAQPAQAGQDYGRHVVLFRTLDPTGSVYIVLDSLVGEGRTLPPAGPCHRHPAGWYRERVGGRERVVWAGTGSTVSFITAERQCKESNAT